MKKIDFNKDWICRSLGGEKREYQVTLPHDAMLREPVLQKAEEREILAGIPAEIMNTENVFMYRRRKTERPLSWNLKVFTIMRKYM